MNITGRNNQYRIKLTEDEVHLLSPISPLKKNILYIHIYPQYKYIYFLTPTITHAPKDPVGSLDFYPHQDVIRSSPPWQSQLRPPGEPSLSTTTDTTTTTTMQ